GRAAVFEPIIDDLTIYITISTSADKNIPPEPCHDADPNSGCGGVGSAYCRPCESLSLRDNPVGAELLVGGHSIGCEVLKPAQYDDVMLRFCLPDLPTLLRWQHISERTFQAILSTAAKNQNEPAKISIFATVYFFDRNIRPLLSSQRKLEQRLKEVRGVSVEENLDSQTYWNLPFNQLILQQRTFIGCHKLYGTVTFSENK
uniref:Laminin IV type A domain-containing protein n=1 Tax=Ascaris lumbricoides TaxID=6252 RepID=A0A0M3IR79_ASCLU